MMYHVLISKTNQKVDEPYYTCLMRTTKPFHKNLDLSHFRYHPGKSVDDAICYAFQYPFRILINEESTKSYLYHEPSLNLVKAKYPPLWGWEPIHESTSISPEKIPKLLQRLNKVKVFL